ncbi:MAG: PEP-utilizing enzyme [Bacteroidetes bacterium]|nr:PEP-utilizing enzyme [Bacteroidota bacterium]
MVKFLREITDPMAGGKAHGLKVLIGLGMEVPGAVVLIHPKIETLDDELVKKHLTILGDGPKAVRSSAMSEDGNTASFAGQFETYLDLHGFEEIKAAIVKCILAANADRLKSYSGKVLSDADLRISVILQNMVDARIAGVVFTANPVNNRRDMIVINAVAGKGEELVSGMKDAMHYEVFRSGSNIAVAAEKNGHLLDEHNLRDILDGALLAETNFDKPVDLEWAIDHTGKLHWLQVRPVTTLEEVHYNELDTVKGVSNDIWTLGNIGEMMPGTATPLTYSVCAEAIDYGMTILAEHSGAYKLKNRTSPRYIQMFYNRLFINMSKMMDYPKNVWLNKASDVQFALSGKVFPGLKANPEAMLFIRILNFFRQMINTARSAKHLEELKKLEAEFNIEHTGTMLQIHASLQKSHLQLGIGFGHHLGASAQSGTLYSAFMRIMTGDKRQPTADDHHAATMLLLNIPEIESADAVKSLERFATLIRGDQEFADRFVQAAPSVALHILQHDSIPEISGQFSLFLERHGHRCVRESELREKTWEENPQQLIQTLQTRVKIGEVKHGRRDEPDEVRIALHQLPFVKRKILQAMIPAARKAVARREITKAYSIKMVSKVRKGYHTLAKKMTESGLLDDPDQIYFLTHDEIGMLLKDKNPGWKIKADKRRKLLPELDKLVFEEVSFGIPEPLEYELKLEITEGQLKGIPVSSGIIEGCVRIIHTLDDAEQLQQGEIMVASFTDIGWTPYFSIIAGLITEIGSPLSHGAVVAREYGIPAIVGAKGARQFLKNGDRVRLNGVNGIIETTDKQD